MNASQLTFEVEGGAMSQTKKVLTKLMEANGNWVPMPFLGTCSRSRNVHSRIADCRKMGYTVENKVERDWLTGERHSFYRIVP